ncbi:MAG: FMN-binding glutamate synthase family protein [Phaeodactylibacter sp.]|nr:FMN-binding glutamate synthase family protein [Phaeodactylibacter sp.]
MRRKFILTALISLALIGAVAYFLWWPFIWALAVVGPLILMGLYDMFQSKHAIMRNYPILGRGRYVMEEWRPKVYQYFIESDTSGTPISRIYRSVVYQRAKKELDTSPFGTQLDVYGEGYEWIDHSLVPHDAHDLEQHPRVTVGGPQCTQPYEASILNVSAMSFGSLSKNAIMALNGGAKLGGFAHNTGEGGISPYHDKFGGDLIYQLGTAYFGARDADGNFSPELFKKRSAADNVKMIELKLSQGAKPGHGGILPARKNTEEIAAIRHVEPFTTVVSPPYHTAFDTPIGLLEFIQQMRELSGGKPIGFKLCIGKRSEFLAICKAMVQTGIYPDFLTVDGGEGGTGAAPLEFSNSVGTPFIEGVAFAYDALMGFDLKQHIKLFSSGKILTGFHIFRAMALGADVCMSARAMMLALGCIQALECNKNNCPTGVATQRPDLVQGLVVTDKKERVRNYHDDTVESFVELLAATGLKSAADINRSLIWRRVNMQGSLSFEELYPYVPKGSLLREDTVPATWKRDWLKARPESFHDLPVNQLKA